MDITRRQHHIQRRRTNPSSPESHPSANRCALGIVRTREMPPSPPPFSAPFLSSAQPRREGKASYCLATCPVIRGSDLCSQGIDLLLSAWSSLCIPSLFPMQIKLMRIRSIMEPVHRSSWWKMGLTTNFPLQLFCNYFGAL